MALPNYQELFVPVLNSFVKNEELSTAEIRERVAKDIKLTNEQLRERYPSGISIFVNQVGWAIAGLHKAGLLRQVHRSVYQLTDAGKKLQAEGRAAIDIGFLQDRYPAYRKWFQNFKSKAKTRTKPETGGTEKLSDSLTPMDRLEEAREQLQDLLEKELYRRMQEEVSPAMFERIAVDLLKAMGYGKDHAASAEVTGGPNDGGIDGVIREDALGLSKIYIQAKKYAAKYTVNSGKVREFAEALSVKKATKGVFVTTSKFAPSAKKEYAERDDIVLIDGEALVRLMIQYEVGVARKDYAIKRVDENYFADEEL